MAMDVATKPFLFCAFGSFGWGWKMRCFLYKPESNLLIAGPLGLWVVCIFFFYRVRTYQLVVDTF
jgi:hypothetical protein